jgi:hypothetical protein
MRRFALPRGFAAFVVLSWTSLAFGPRLQAADAAPSLPPVMKSGLDAYASGPEAAVSAWLKGSPSEGGRYASEQAEALRRAQNYLGPYKSYEWLAVKDVGERTRLLYFTLNFKRGALFFRFQLYQSDDGWVVQNMTHHMTPEEAMPWLAASAGR